MFVSINKENMTFCHKHRIRNIVLDLVYLECANVRTHVTPLHDRFLWSFTETELQLLYKNTTGGKFSLHTGDKLRAVLLDVAERLQENEVDPAELSRQCSAVSEGSKDAYMYVQGASVPAVQESLWAPNPKVVPALSLSQEQDIVVNFRSKIVDPNTVRKFDLPLEDEPHKESRPRTLTEPRGGVREHIWKVADQMWEEAGKPNTVSIVLSLRKKMMATLEEQGVKKTSASSELGNWQKMRLSA